MYYGKKILIVDDSPTERHNLIDMISELGLQIIEATNGAEGIQKAIEYEPSIILMDVVMPGINGFQATKQISTNDRLKKTPIIMCTSKGEAQDKVWGARQGAKAYVVKPVDKEILLNEINKLLE